MWFSEDVVIMFPNQVIPSLENSAASYPFPCPKLNLVNLTWTGVSTRVLILVKFLASIRGRELQCLSKTFFEFCRTIFSGNQLRNVFNLVCIGFFREDDKFWMIELVTVLSPLLKNSHWFHVFNIKAILSELRTCKCNLIATMQITLIFHHLVEFKDRTN